MVSEGKRGGKEKKAGTLRQQLLFVGYQHKNLDHFPLKNKTQMSIHLIELSLSLFFSFYCFKHRESLIYDLFYGFIVFLLNHKYITSQQHFLLEEYQKLSRQIFLSPFMFESVAFDLLT